MHILSEYDYAKVVWFSDGYRLDGNQWNNPKDWIASWFSGYDSSTISKMAIICWFLWKDRCSMVFENKTQTPKQSTHSIDKFLHNAVSVSKKNNDPAKSLAVPKWQPPYNDFIKLNIDASYCDRTNTCGYGLIFLNCAGTHVTSKCSSFIGELDAHYLESLAVLEGVQWGLQLGLKKIIIESDYKSLIQAIRREEYDIP
ncbi:uncharacterized protein LOC113279269 [Papaver somniferum]|uniref:uncharacterized protein LOC113279269 n=1 Tax=Papaver somniferum TaxID=3469 RepID=UPI000E702C60|nr:uncharacterized protein LOC113279269 [Papaver somniferum]